MTLLDPPCSTAARARGDRRVGTAPPARRWFLVEQDGAWGRTAWDGIDVRAHAQEALRTGLDAVGARLQLIRRPGARPVSGGRDRRWCAVDTATGAVRWGVATCDSDLVRAAEVFGEAGLGSDGLGTEGTGTVDTQGPFPGIVLVCTHGLKDVCCAVRGRPVAAALAARWPEAVWETTHTGGDRFAANVVVLPDGAVYGGADPDTAEADLAAHAAGRVDPTRLRGRAGLTPQAQAAHVAVLQQHGPMPWGAAVVRRQTGTPEAWQVELDSPTGRLVVSGTASTTEPEFLTCRAANPAPMHLPVVQDVRPA